MNRVMLIGRLTAKPELKNTNSGIAVAKFSVAINRAFSNAQGQKETDFINITAWRKQAENICNFLDKGSLVSIEGKLQTGSYTDKDGNKKFRMDVIADSVQFLESKSKSQNRQEFTNNSKGSTSPYDYQDVPTTNDVSVENDPFADFGDSVTIDENFLD